MRIKNNITPKELPHANSGFYEAEILYKHKVDGSLTDDIENAMCNADGMPLIVEIRPSTETLASVVTPCKPLTLSPADPSSRAICLEQFGMLNKKASMPTLMLDRIDAVRYAENVSIAMQNSINAAKSSLTLPTPEPSKPE